MLRAMLSKRLMLINVQSMFLHEQQMDGLIPTRCGSLTLYNSLDAVITAIIIHMEFHCHRASGTGLKTELSTDLKDVSPVATAIVAAPDDVGAPVQSRHPVPGSLHRALGTGHPVIDSRVVTVRLFQVSHAPASTRYVNLPVNHRSGVGINLRATEYAAIKGTFQNKYNETLWYSCTVNNVLY